ncbi:HTH-type transcriptional regulator BetI [Nonomuraea coxensis DSM 45129]|uniref:HTH-type transcriptional regulator BetI n=1 Tax=Nonomuraea coxensis DSM 45129 TaxID=1122611 RepID=A0ABX8UAD2_9ACTN|nr:TetR/AcrR family transcriptional regulator [Nonomuraea coxensis]QYC44396.1 HTH-type transcriptional regulator BetI [Nonomuraea coxensis DSM 45129]
MPKIVDHDERRREVLSAARRVIVRDGIDAATTRAIAKEAGYSNGVLAHYFADKDEILLSALRQSHQRIRERLTGKVEGASGLAALRELLLDNLPLDAERTQESRLEVSFWSRSLASERLAGVQRAEAGELRAAVRELLGQARAAGELRGDHPDDGLDDLAEHLLALVDGLSLHLLLYPDRLTRVDVERLMLRALDRL